MFTNAVQELAKALKTTVPEPDDNGGHSFVFDKILKISVLPFKKDSLVIVAPVTESLSNLSNSQSQENEELLKKLLQINFSRLKEYEETLTWDPDSAQIILSKEIPFSQLSEKPLFGQLEKFINNLEFWKRAANQESTPIPHLPS